MGMYALDGNKESLTKWMLPDNTLKEGSGQVVNLRDSTGSLTNLGSVPDGEHEIVTAERERIMISKMGGIIRVLLQTPEVPRTVGIVPAIAEPIIPKETVAKHIVEPPMNISKPVETPELKAPDVTPKQKEIASTPKPNKVRKLRVCQWCKHKDGLENVGSEAAGSGKCEICGKKRERLYPAQMKL